MYRWRRISNRPMLQQGVVRTRKSSATLTMRLRSSVGALRDESESAGDAVVGTTAAVPVPVDEDVPKGCVRLNLLGYSGVFNARLVLLLVPALWGSFPPACKWLYRMPWSLHPIAFNGIRLFVSALVMTPTAIQEFRWARKGVYKDHKQILTAGAELGFWTFLGSTLQLLGIEYTTASRGAFLTQLQTIIVPVGAFAFGLGSLSWHVWLASLLAISGVGLLTLDNVAQALTFRGDGFMILTAMVSATYVIRTRCVATKLRSGPLVAFKVIFQMIYAVLYMMYSSFSSVTAKGSSIASLFVGATPLLLLINTLLVLWGGAGVSAMSSWLQIRGNTVVPATETAVIFSFTPLWASALAMFLGERFGLRGIVGGSLIVVSAILASRSRKAAAPSGSAASS